MNMIAHTVQGREHLCEHVGELSISSMTMNNTFWEAIVSVNTLNITIQNRITLHLFIVAITLHFVGVHCIVKGRQNKEEETRWKQCRVSENVSVFLSFPLSCFPLLYFSGGTWDSANNCCKQTKQTNYTVSPHCNIAVMDDDVPWKHSKKYSLLL